MGYHGSMKLKGPVTSKKMRLLPLEDSPDLPPWAIELLLEASEQLSEGQVQAEPRDEERFYGSTMITIDLERIADRVREPITPELAHAIADALGASEAFHERMERLGRLEAERRIAMRLPRHSDAEVRLRVVGTSILIDVDIECRLVKPRAPGRQGVS